MLCAHRSHVFNMEFLEMGTSSPEMSLDAVLGDPRVSLVQLREACVRKERSKKKIQRQAQKTRLTLSSLLWGWGDITTPAPTSLTPLSSSHEDFAAMLIFQAKHEAHCDRSPPSSLGRAEDQICPKFSPTEMALAISLPQVILLCSS